MARGSNWRMAGVATSAWNQSAHPNIRLNPQRSLPARGAERTSILELEVVQARIAIQNGGYPANHRKQYRDHAKSRLGGSHKRRSDAAVPGAEKRIHLQRRDG